MVAPNIPNIPDPGHSHVWDQHWELYGEFDYIRTCHCTIVGCNATGYGLFDNTHHFIRFVTAQAVEEHISRIEELLQEHRVADTILTNDYQTDRQRLREKLHTDLLRNKIALLGGIK